MVYSSCSLAHCYVKHWGSMSLWKGHSPTTMLMNPHVDEHVTHFIKDVVPCKIIGINENCIMILFYSGKSYHYQFLHMPRQLCCCGMCKILYWSVHWNLDENKITFALNSNFDGKSLVELVLVPPSRLICTQGSTVLMCFILMNLVSPTAYIITASCLGADLI